MFERIIVESCGLLFSSTLAVTRISMEDEAIYQCIAENSAGTNQASARLAVARVQDLPVSPRGLRATALSNVALQITWSPPPAEVIDTIIGYVLHIRKTGGEFDQCRVPKPFSSSFSVCLPGHSPFPTCPMMLELHNSVHKPSAVPTVISIE